MSWPARLSPRRWMEAALRIRFLKFATVGASGTLVNLGILYLGQEYLFTTIQAAGRRLNVSLVLAIFCATVNNFAWNRGWTWGDRKSRWHKPILIQFGQYALACWLGILLQAVFTKLLAAHCHYLVANVTAIALAGIFNFLANDLWTFAIGRLWSPRREATGTGGGSWKSEIRNPPVLRSPSSEAILRRVDSTAEGGKSETNSN